MQASESPAALAEVQATAASLWTELSPAPTSVVVRNGDIEVRLEVTAPVLLGSEQAGQLRAQSAAPADPHAGQGMLTAAGQPTVEPNGYAVEQSVDECVCSPLVGVFFHAPGPDGPPFVAVGDRIEKGQQVGIIEAMKMMVPVESDLAGRVVRILVANGEQVEYASPLLAVAGD